MWLLCVCAYPLMQVYLIYIIIIYSLSLLHFVESNMPIIIKNFNLGSSCSQTAWPQPPALPCIHAWHAVFKSLSLQDNTLSCRHWRKLFIQIIDDGDIAHERIEDPELEPLIKYAPRPITMPASAKYTKWSTYPYCKYLWEIISATCKYK